MQLSAAADNIGKSCNMIAQIFHLVIHFIGGDFRLFRIIGRILGDFVDFGDCHINAPYSIGLFF